MDREDADGACSGEGVLPGYGRRGRGGSCAALHQLHGAAVAPGRLHAAPGRSERRCAAAPQAPG